MCVQHQIMRMNTNIIATTRTHVPLTPTYYIQFQTNKRMMCVSTLTLAKNSSHERRHKT